MSSAITVTATFADGALYPDEPLPLVPHQRVKLTVEVPEAADPWPANVAEIYRELADEDRRLSSEMLPTVRETARLRPIPNSTASAQA
jgi:hypothetical protein